MFGIQGGYLGNTAGLAATSPDMIAGSPSFEINEGAKTRKMRGIRNRQEQGAPGEREAAEELMRRLGGPQLPMASMGGMPGAVGNMGGIQAFEDALNELSSQNIRGSKYRYEQETIPSFFHNKRVY